ncbi:MAG: iron ABC transporter permease [Phycisphaerales bacterium]|nr:iron ABC transporter permease [Phycisphaerales bacterium]
MQSRASSNLFALLLLAFLGVTLIAPIAAVVRGGFQEDGRFTLGWFSDILDDPEYRDGLWNSVKLATAVTIGCVLIAIPLAMIAENYNFAGKRWWLALIQAPLILPPFVGAIGLKGLLSRTGGINSLLASVGLIDPAAPIDWLADKFWACVALETLGLYPIMFLNVQAALANIDPALDEAARNLGAGAWRRFWRVTLPLMRPGIFAGCTINFIWAFTELGTPLVVGYRKLTVVQVFDSLETHNPQGDAYALVIVLMAASILCYLVGKLVLGRPMPGMMAKATVSMPPLRVRGVRALAAGAPFAVVFFLAILPHIGVILGSITATGALTLSPSELTLRHHAELLRDVVSPGAGGRSAVALSVINSFKYSLLSTAVDIVLGFAIAYLIVRRRGPLTTLLDTIAMLPLAVPGLVMAFGYFALTQGDSPLAFLNPLKGADPTPLLVVAYSVRRLPFMVRSLAAGLEQTSVALEEAAANLGARPLRIMLSVVVPLVAANFIAGGLLVFNRAMLEVSDGLVLAFDANTYPMTKAIYTITANPESGLEVASALGTWGMLLLIITTAGASLALGKRLGALFRV